MGMPTAAGADLPTSQVRSTRIRMARMSSARTWCRYRRAILGFDMVSLLRDQTIHATGGYPSKWITSGSRETAYTKVGGDCLNILNARTRKNSTSSTDQRHIFAGYFEIC